jgi:hypothetical protein
MSKRAATPTRSDVESVLEIFRGTGMLRLELTVKGNEADMDYYREILIAAINEAISIPLKTTEVE